MLRRVRAAWAAFKHPRAAQDAGYRAGFSTCRARIYDMLRSAYNKRNGTVTLTVNIELLTWIMELRP